MINNTDIFGINRLLKVINHFSPLPQAMAKKKHPTKSIEIIFHCVHQNELNFREGKELSTDLFASIDLWNCQWTSCKSNFQFEVNWIYVFSLQFNNFRKSTNVHTQTLVLMDLMDWITAKMHKVWKAICFGHNRGIGVEKKLAKSYEISKLQDLRYRNAWLIETPSKKEANKNILNNFCQQKTDYKDTKN